MKDSEIFDNNSKVRQDLTLFGVSERESSIYFALLANGESKAGELASLLGLHRLDVYHDLKSMQSKNLVEATISKPMKFSAIPLEVVVRHLRRNDGDQQKIRGNALFELQKYGDELKTRANIQNGRSTETGDKIQIIGGQKAISERWTNLLESAQNEILVAAIDRGSAKLLLMREMDEIQKKMKAGVSVRIFTPVLQSNSSQFKEVASEVRHLDSINSAGVCIVDRREVMIIPESGNGNQAGLSPDEVAILITSPSIVEMFRVLFFVGWDTSPTIGELENTQQLG